MKSLQQWQWFQDLSCLRLLELLGEQKERGYENNLSQKGRLKRLQQSGCSIADIYTHTLTRIHVPLDGSVFWSCLPSTKQQTKRKKKHRPNPNQNSTPAAIGWCWNTSPGKHEIKRTRELPVCCVRD